MSCTAELRLELPDPETASAALAPDDDGHLEHDVEDGQLVLRTASASPLGLLRTLDDALGCLRATGIE